MAIDISNESERNELRAKLINYSSGVEGLSFSSIALNTKIVGDTSRMGVLAARTLNRLSPALTPSRVHMRGVGNAIDQFDVEKRNRYNIKTFTGQFRKSINNSLEEKTYKGSQKLISEILAYTNRSQLVKFIQEAGDNQELHKYLNKGREEGIIIDYCYPDLELPKYMDIPFGDKYRQVYHNVGVPTSLTTEKEYLQSIRSEVDPDFFIYKQPVWGILDQDSPGTVKASLDIATANFRQLVENSVAYRTSKEALDEVKAQAQMEFGTSKNIPDEKRPDEYTNAEEMMRNKWKVIRVGDGDSFFVDINGKEEEVRIVGYDAPETKDSPSGNKKKSKYGSVAQKALATLLEGEEVYLHLTSDRRDIYSRLLAYVTIDKGDGNIINVGKVMISNARELRLKRWTDYTSSLAPEIEDQFYKSHELFIKNYLAGD